MNGYMEALRQAMILFPVLAVLVTVPYIAYNYHKYGSILSLRILIVYSFLLYLLCAYCLVILPLPTGAAAANLHGYEAQLMPFAFLQDILENAHVVWSQPRSWLSIFSTGAFLTTIFNLFMTMPFGMYLRYYFRCSWKKTLLLSFLLSLLFELTQLTGLYFIYPGSYRLFDVDDLMVNTAGSMAGYGLARFAARFLPTREELDQESLIRGQQVSLLRRMLAFFYDMIACVVVGTIAALLYCSRFGSMRVWNYAAAWAAYSTLCPLLCRGQTLGHKMTRLKIVSTTGGKPRWFQYSVRYGSLLAGLALVPYLLNLCISTLAARGMVTTLAALIAYGIVNGGYLFFLLVEAVRMAIHRRLFYERWSRTKLESTIEVSEKRPS